jgi:uncharacterized protein (DUF1501 family)
MERRKFLKSTALASTLPILFNHIPVMASSELESSNLEAMATAAAECGKILVIIQLNGGNDGLNTVFPRDKWSELSKARSNILMNENQVLPLNGNLTTGLHPAMSEMKNMYDEGKMMIVQGVSYPNPSYSHFRATDIWFTASDSNKSLTTGWLGRSLNEIYPRFPYDYPSIAMPDPLAIQIGSTLPFSLQGPNINMAYSVPDPQYLLDVINETTDPVADSDYGLELKFLRLMKDQSNAYKDAIQKAYNYTKPQSATYPNNNYLADQLKIVAKLINGGLKTPIYIVNHPDFFDSHENQVLDSDRTKGRQAKNLKILSEAVAAFQKDLKIIGKEDKVTGMTFSEFGRRIKSNDSNGTDHGTCAPVMFFGAALNTGTKSVKDTAEPVSGMIGKSVALPANAGVDDEIPMQFDFRQIYTTIMQDWLCLSETQTTDILGKKYDKLPIFRSKLITNPNLNFENEFMTLFSNPVIDGKISLQFNSVLKSVVNISIFSILGAKVFTNQYAVEGDLLVFEVASLSTGTYVLQLDYSGTNYTKKLLVL